MSARVNSYDKLVAGMIRENGDSNLPLRLRTKLAEIMRSKAGAEDIFAFCEASMNALKKRDQYQPGHFILHAFKEFAKSGNV